MLNSNRSIYVEMQRFRTLILMINLEIPNLRGGRCELVQSEKINTKIVLILVILFQIAKHSINVVR